MSSAFFGVIGADIDDLDVGAGEGFFDAAGAFEGILGIAVADEEHDFAAVGEGFLDEGAGLFAGGFVIGADIGDAFAGGGIAVAADEEGLVGDVVEEGGLVIGVVHADGDAVHALGDKVIEDLALFGGGAGGGDAEIDINIAEFLGGLVAAGVGKGPEVRGVVADEGELEMFAGGRGAGGGGGAVIFAAATDGEDGTEGEDG